MKVLLAAALSVMPALATAGELATVAGRYSYTDYSVTLPSGRVLHMNDIDVTGGILEVADTGSITLRLTRSSGEVIVQTARVFEAHFSKGAGFWRAKWPDMTYVVQTDFTVKGETLTTVTKFDNPFDDKRYGSVERAVLKKVAAH